MVVARLNKVVSLKRSHKDAPLAGVSDEEIARRQAELNAAARAKLLSEFGALSVAQVAKRAVWRPDEVPSSETVRQWKRQGLAFTVNHQGRSVYPAFQFNKEGRPRPVVADVLATLGQQGRGWQLALWFTSANGWVDGRRPVDLLHSEPEEVAQAAKWEAEGLFF